jgi:hypothetical protein
MLRLGILPLVAALGLGAGGDDVLPRIRANVAAQIARATNYECVETIERSYYIVHGRQGTCGQLAAHAKTEPFLSDRLRLDVAVSNNLEIYSWHGANRFTSSRIDSVVHSGPISSGGFVGYLRNIFLEPGVMFIYQGTSSEELREIYHFDYRVPMQHTFYSIGSGESGVLVPFHGSFSADVRSLELTGLTVVADDIPEKTDICGVETQVRYQLARISGFDSLIPASFDLLIGDRRMLFTESRGSYRECREFRTESTLRFDSAEPAGSSSAIAAVDAGTIPADLNLHLGLRTDIDEHSYAGDPVEAVVLKPVKVRKSGVVIPAGATVHGVIAMLEIHPKPAKHYYLDIEFERLSFDNKSFTLGAVHRPDINPGTALVAVFGTRLPVEVQSALAGGVMIFDSRDFHLRRGFSGTWHTTKPDVKEVSLH